MRVRPKNDIVAHRNLPRRADPKSTERRRASFLSRQAHQPVQIIWIALYICQRQGLHSPIEKKTSQIFFSMHPNGQREINVVFSGRLWQDARFL